MRKQLLRDTYNGKHPRRAKKARIAKQSLKTLKYIAKRKEHTQYEFGNKVRLVTTFKKEKKSSKTIFKKFGFDGKSV